MQIIKKYQVFLFDADNTLYDYDAAEANALRIVLEHCGFEYSDEIRAKYRKINATAWASWENGEMSKEYMQVWRFECLLKEIGLHRNAADFNTKYLAELGKGAILIDGAEEVCRRITAAGRQIYIATNGLLATQEARKHSAIQNM